MNISILETLTVMTLKSIVIWLLCHVAWRKPDVSEGHISSIFRVEKEAKQEISKLCCLLL
jgi:hypothetical protein